MTKLTTQQLESYRRKGAGGLVDAYEELQKRVYNLENYRRIIAEEIAVSENKEIVGMIEDGVRFGVNSVVEPLERTGLISKEMQLRFINKRTLDETAKNAVKQITRNKVFIASMEVNGK